MAYYEDVNFDDSRDLLTSEEICVGEFWDGKTPEERAADFGVVPKTPEELAEEYKNGQAVAIGMHLITFGIMSQEELGKISDAEWDRRVDNYNNLDFYYWGCWAD